MRDPGWRWLLVAFVFTLTWQGSASHARAEQAHARSAREVYQSSCAACHGIDGRGAPPGQVGFDTPLPDFTDCSFATREPDADWFAIAHDGGPVRAFHRRMPAFGEAIDAVEIQRAIEHIRGFCGEPSWPRGDLNLPRPLATEKAFPEDEAVFSTVVGTGATGTVTNEFLYERRFGARNQIEIAVPVAMAEGSSGAWSRGLGDVAVALKRVLFHSLNSGSILSATGELVLPTGDDAEGLGKGVGVVEPFLTYGQLLPRNAFLQAQAGAELPFDRAVASNEAFWRVAFGRTYEQGRFGRAWSPMIELLGARELVAGEPVTWDLVPQIQVSLSKRQHVLINGGVRIPLNERGERHAEVLTYFLWDWFDGGLFDGWR
jgi:mono/diheme cytochrome c family protein